MRSFVVLLLISSFGAASAGAESISSRGPQRIVSLNLCADELVLRLVEKSRIASITWLSRDPRNSTMSARAAETPVNSGQAEEVVAQSPDLILAGRYTTRSTVRLLEQIGLRVTKLDPPRSFAEAREQIRTVAKAVAEPARGNAMVAALDARLAKHPVRPVEERPWALVVQPNGFTVGPGSLVDEVLGRAGARNLAAALGVDGYAQLPLEVLATAGADILIVNSEQGEAPALATEFLRHPVLSRLPQRPKIVPVPTRLWTCGGPALADAVDLVARTVREIAAERIDQ